MAGHVLKQHFRNHSFGTEARGINDRGDIVGICENANGVHGFLLHRGIFTLIE